MSVSSREAITCPADDVGDQKSSLEPLPDQRKVWIQQRHLAVFFAVSGAAICLMLRMNLSIAIVDMTSHNKTHNPQDWNPSMQGYILGAYFYSNTLFNPLGGQLADQLGPRWVMFAGNFIPALLTILTPVIVSWSTGAFITLRVIQGIFGASVAAAGYSLVARWLPTEEKTFALGMIQAGVYMGCLAAMLLTGYLCDAIGWEGSFYVLGSLPLIWCTAYLFLIYDSPDTHPLISQQELDFLRQRGVCSAKSSAESSSKKPQTPWMAIFTCRAFWATIIAKICFGFGAYMAATKLPAYMNDVFGVPIEQNGLFNALPFLGCTISAFACSRVAQWMIQRKIISLLNVRRLNHIIGNAGPALCLFLVTLSGSSVATVEVLLILSQVLGAFVAAGDCPNVADYSGVHFTGLIFGLTNMVISAQGFIAPALVPPILDMFPTLVEGWNCVFYLTVGIYSIGTVAFWFMASAEPQDWAK